MSKRAESRQIDSIHSLDTDRIGNTVSNISFVTAYERCLAMAFVFLRAYTAVA
jgi:hypothetical protein